MKKYRTLSIFISVILIFANIISVNAADFQDVSSTKYSWAANAISSMVEKNIIKGYEDGTFKPENSITKLEALVLSARVLGFNVSENRGFVNTAIENYSEMISKYKINFGVNEIAYLVAKKVISTDELSEYIGNGLASTGMKRYEIAVLLTKVLGAEDEVEKILITSLGYTDATKIPAQAKKYVEYVTNKGIMSGMGDNIFSPNTDVTRAQAAVLFDKILTLSDLTFKKGLVESIDHSTNVIKIKNQNEILEYTITDSVFLSFEGSKISIADIAPEYEAIATFKNGMLYSLDFVTPALDFEMYARVADIDISKVSYISVYEISENGTDISNGEKISFAFGDGCFFVKGNEIISLEDIAPDDYVKLNFKEGKIASVSLLSKTETVSGVVSEINLSSDSKITITLSNNTKKEYYPTNKTEISRDDLQMNLSDISIGDMVVIKTNYGHVSKITIASPIFENKGVIKEIIISANPRITLESDGNLTTYKIANYCVFEFSGKKTAELYDLRIDIPVTISIQDNMVVKIKS